MLNSVDLWPRFVLSLERPMPGIVRKQPVAWTACHEQPAIVQVQLKLILVFVKHSPGLRSSSDCTILHVPRKSVKLVIMLFRPLHYDWGMTCHDLSACSLHFLLLRRLSKLSYSMIIVNICCLYMYINLFKHCEALWKRFICVKALSNWLCYYMYHYLYCY